MSDEQRKRRRPYIQPGDTLELVVRYEMFEDGSDFFVSEVLWKWNGRCPAKGSATSLQRAETDAVRALMEWTRS